MPRKGSTAARGYGWKHQRERKQWEPIVQAGKAYCWRCLANGISLERAWIKPGSRWDLGHADERLPDGSRETKGPEHVGRECPVGGNRATAGRKQPAPALNFFS